MRRALLALGFAAAGLYLADGNAAASEAAIAAERGGALLGYALRCGVAERRLEPSARLMHQFVASLADNVEEQLIADRVFAARVRAGATAVAGDRLPDCALVRRKLAAFEHHLADRTAATSPLAGAAQSGVASRLGTAKVSSTTNL